ncbi:ATP-grasp domain-containing protein [Streptomyces iakyrus]|uniref:ATP-grasp domain-containing protein n=1 Tax=Streptomyces iakyrus TaxID=68219 RepID=UPI0005271C4C|nr:ATP-grasp domain-containing protein [Streptomyces iakyrus]
MEKASGAIHRPSGTEIPFAYQVISRVAPRLDIVLELEPWGREAARLEFPNGRIAYFRHGNLDINRSGSADLARDKYACAHFLANAGIPVPWSFPIRALDAVIDEHLGCFVAQHSWPLIVKPNSRYGGQGVEKVDNMPALRHAVKQALRMDKIALVQPFVRGHDVRVVVLDGSPIAAYCRIPPVLVGDGRRSIQLLLEGLYVDGETAGPARRLPDHGEVAARLARRAGGLDRVPRSGEHVPLVDAANVATGADVVDLSRALPADVLDLAVSAAQTAGLRLAGVDLLVDLGMEHPDLLHSQTHRDATHGARSDEQCVVLEINSAPELDGFASLGDSQAALVEHLYETILRELAR